MYFCPCSCSKQDGENEDDVLICLPRNLSYAGESYLDCYSVSSAFVHNAKREKQLYSADVQDKYVKAGASAYAEALRLKHEESEGTVEEETVCDSNFVLSAPAIAMANSQLDLEAAEKALLGNLRDTFENTMALTISPTITIPSPCSRSLLTSPLTVTIDRDEKPDSKDFSRYITHCVETPDSVSEEGIFVNITDGLDAMEMANGKSTASEASDDTYVSGDSMYYSPEETDGIDDDHDHDLKFSIEKAVQKAAAIHLHDIFPVFTRSCSENEHFKRSVADFVEQQYHGSELMEAETVGVEVAERDKNNSCDTEAADLELLSTGSQNSISEKRNLRDCVNELKITINDRPLHSEDKGPLSSSYRDLVSPESPLFEDREFNFHRSELRKSTSLKSTKTPPGTPRRKKVVRFADAMGLDLESVRHILNLESPPKIPASAMKDLQSGLSQDRKGIGTKYIVETFPQPGADIHFRDRVLTQKVVLENALVVAGSITGLVRVANAAYHKTVRVRFTTNAWSSFHDIAASYMLNSNDGPTDRFSFTITPPSDFGPGCKLEFAISYNAGGVEFWDNNFGQNYVFDCFAKTTPTEGENSWMHFL